MAFSVVFAIFAAALYAAFRLDARIAIWLFAGGMIATVALYLHHATDVLTLSF